MILKYLFAQYDTRRGPIFASKLMTKMGEIFMGSLEDKGLGHLRQDLKDSYYRTAPDRRLPKGTAALIEWQRQSIQVSEYRQVEHPQIALATTLFLLMSSVVLVAAASPFNGSLKKTLELDEGGRVSQMFSRVRSSSSEATSGALLSECQSIQRTIINSGSALAANPDLDRRWSECQGILAKAALEGGTN